VELKAAFCMYCPDCEEWFPGEFPGWIEWFDEHKHHHRSRSGGPALPIVRGQRPPKGYSCPVTPVALLAWEGAKWLKLEREEG